MNDFEDHNQTQHDDVKAVREAKRSLKPKQLAALRLMTMTYLTQEEIADKLNTTRQTLWRWKAKDQHFQTVYRHRLNYKTEVQNLIQELNEILDEFLNETKGNGDQ